MAQTLGYMITWTTYGTWLQGDDRQYVKNGQILPANNALAAANMRALTNAPVRLSFNKRRIVEAAIQEVVDAIGVSILSGAPMTLFPAILKAMKEKGAGDIILFGGGIVPDEEIKELEALGVAKVFTPGAPTEESIRFLREAVEKKKSDEKIM